MPARLRGNEKSEMPVCVLLHSYSSDQSIFSNIAQTISSYDYFKTGQR